MVLKKNEIIGIVHKGTVSSVCMISAMQELGLCDQESLCADVWSSVQGKFVLINALSVDPKPNSEPLS